MEPSSVTTLSTDVPSQPALRMRRPSQDHREGTPLADHRFRALLDRRATLRGTESRFPRGERVALEGEQVTQPWRRVAAPDRMAVRHPPAADAFSVRSPRCVRQLSVHREINDRTRARACQ